jgi:DNA-binding CsgD family transcriptional regulator
MTTPLPPRVVTISVAQRKVIGELTRDGAENKEIGRRLGMSTETVRSHMARAMEIVGATNRTHLAILLLRGGIRVRVGDGRQRKEAS